MIKARESNIGVKEAGELARDEVQAEVVQAYATAMRNGDLFPPILIGWDNGKRRIFDGNHRIAAADLIGLKMLPCWILDEKDLSGLLAKQFEGQLPELLYVLDGWISIGGKPYVRYVKG